MPLERAHASSATRGRAYQVLRVPTLGLWLARSLEKSGKLVEAAEPMAGMWIHETADGIDPFSGTEAAVARAIMVNGCSPGTSYDDATYEDYPSTATPSAPARRCWAARPTTPFSGNGHASHDYIAEPGFSAFFEALFAP